MLDFHKWTNEDGEVLILRRIPKNRITKNGFVWPTGVGTVVTCPDWNPQPVCGGGLHGWPWGWGLGEGCDYDIVGDIWLVVGCKPEDVVGELDGGCKCKFRAGTIRLEGSFADAMNKVAGGFGECVSACAKQSNGNGSRAASSGNGSHAASNGDYSRAASSGDYSHAASNGYGSRAASNGDYSQAASNGYDSHAASNGYGSHAASNGNGSRAASNGDYSQAASNGDYSRAEAIGKDTLAAVVGNHGRVRVGERGAFALAYWDEADGWHFLTGKVGENGIEANTWYEIRDKKIVKCQK